MLKGNSRRVIVVPSPDAKLFEQAIFILKEDAAKKTGVTSEDILKEACKAADIYMKKNLGKRSRKANIKGPLFAAAGAGATAVAWLLSTIIK